MGWDLDQLFVDIQGLNSSAQLILGPGFVREEWKTLCFQRGYSINGQAILSAKAWAESMVPESTDRVMSSSSRVELLKQEFRKPELKDALPLLSSLSRRSGFFEKLDQSLQSGRMNFAHGDEASVISEVLNEKTGRTIKREEYFLLNRYWNRLLELMNLWDESRLIDSAVSKVRLKTVPLKSLIYRAIHMKEAPKWEWFWSEISQVTEVRVLDTIALKSVDSVGIHLKGAHFLEDAAHFMFDQIEKNLQSQVIVIQDRPEIRRTLNRVAGQRKIILMDSRDPTAVIRSETIKVALLELELVAKGFPRALALEWIRLFHSSPGQCRKKVIESGLVQGLEAYRFIPEIHQPFQEIQRRYASRMDLASLRKEVFKSVHSHHLPVWVARILERIFDEWESSLKLLKLDQRRRPLRIWSEEIRQKISQANPVVDPIRKQEGLQVYRVDQAPSLVLNRDAITVNFFGVGDDYFNPRDVRSDWFSLRDHEILTSEFGWISASTTVTQNRKSFDVWNFNHASVFWTYRYDESGSENPSLDLVWTEAEILSKEELGGHPLLLKSWKNIRSGIDLESEIPFSSLQPTSGDAWSFSFFQDYGKCPFVAFAQHLLKLQDEREVEVEPAADRFGVLLHGILEEWIKHPGEIEDVIQRVWEKTPLLGWEKNERWAHATRTRLSRILENFSKDDSEYRIRSGSKVLDTEKEITHSIAGLSLKGRVDRIDEHDDGLVVIDYKSGGKFCDGRKTLETGKDLQLGLYSIAIREIFQKEVISAQYLNLDEQSVNRHKGFLFTEWNKSKKTDSVEYPITLARSNSASLFSESPTQIWSQLQSKAESVSALIQSGSFRPNPSDPLDCAQCRFRGVCGEERR